MIRCYTSAIAIIAKHESASLAIFHRHGLFFNVSIESPELAFHVGYALGADRTLIACVAPLSETTIVYAVTTAHECHWFR